MEPAQASVRIRRPPAVVHELVDDLARHASYLDHFLVDWTITSPASRGVGAAARLRAKGGGRDDEIAIAITDVRDGAIAIETRSGRRERRRMRLVYAVRAAPGAATQVTATVELVEGSLVDRLTWSIARTHLERQYARGMLRLKALLEGDAA